jgi:hypothetical protein
MSFRQSEGMSNEKPHDLEYLIMKFPQSKKRLFRNDILVYKLNLIIIAKEV